MVSTSLTEAIATAAKSSVEPLRLFCFHHAGGHEKSAFLGWQRKLGDLAEVVPVRLPHDEEAHRGSRRAGPPDVARLIQGVNDEIDPWTSTPHVFYGHSMGALVAYQVTRLRQKLALPLPERLLVGAYPGPHLPHRLAGAARLADEELRALLPADPVYRSRAVREALERTAVTRLRTHLGICDAPVPLPAREAAGSPTAGKPALSCPIEVFAGEDDTMVTAAEAAAWELHTHAGCRVHHMPGGHFFTRDSVESKNAFFARLATVLAECTAVASDDVRDRQHRIAS
ncbi:thioesterase II family protein [Streptomyces mirabilis]|uniref:thioesterase II family protein n=1 Tax=Streptomyces mirabilis TaxID=68239 RepID=UPI002251C8D8|nr:alpha/beta fold hydrolase [Streptomyces mirabilis]MCX4617723.1 alpha/beta fold hydrolase [Streptomyces mirabilis]